jgi:hypothetical protein
LFKYEKMDLQTRKLNLITYLATLKDENIFSKIEKYIMQKSNDVNISDNQDVFTLEDLKKRIKKSEEDYNERKIQTQEEFEKISENW